jgi:hypothetical protein
MTAERASRTYAAQWVMFRDIAMHLGISDSEAQEAIRAERAAALGNVIRIGLGSIYR